MLVVGKKLLFLIISFQKADCFIVPVPFHAWNLVLLPVQKLQLDLNGVHKMHTNQVTRRDITVLADLTVKKLGSFCKTTRT